MKKLAKVMLVVGLMSMMFSACDKKVECSVCGETKSGTTKDIFGEKVSFCNDCVDDIKSLGLN